MRLSFILIVLLMLAGSKLRAQDRVDLLYLKSGETLRGNLIRYEKGKSIMFVLNSGDTLNSEGETLDLIKGMRVGKKNRQGYIQKTNGIWHHYELGANFESEAGSTLYPQGAIQANVGYQWGRMKKIGIGTGIEAMEDFNIIPIYMTVRGDWFEGSKVTPYHFLNLGFAVATARSNVWEDQYNDISGGLRVNPGIGIKVHQRRSFITISMGYLLQDVEYQESFWGGWWDSTGGFSEVSRSFRRMSFRVGIGF